MVENACQDALDIIGVIPMHNFETRENRTCALKVSMDFPELLSNYFATKSDLSHKRNDLTEKALMLWQRYLDEQEEQI